MRPISWPSSCSALPLRDDIAHSTWVQCEPEGLVRPTWLSSEPKVAAKPQHFFLERYAEAYRRELEHFIAAVSAKTPPATSGADGLAALVLADACVESARTGKPVRVASAA